MELRSRIIGYVAIKKSSLVSWLRAHGKGYLLPYISLAEPRAHFSLVNIVSNDEQQRTKVNIKLYKA